MKISNTKTEKGEKILGGITYKQYNESRKKNLAKIDETYEEIIAYFKKISPLDFINKFLNRNLFVSKKNLINTRLSDIEINYNIFKEIVLGLEKSDENKCLTIDEEVEKKINQICKKANISPISKYMPYSINVNPFPFEHQNKRENNKDDDSEKKLNIVIRIHVRGLIN